MGVSWTEEQQKVIDLRNRNILVSAAAGSGKTAVLVQRIITMLTDSAHPMDVDELLCVTFTEAAAAEMKERVRDAIERELAIHPEDEHLLRQATLIHNAQITTTHSFCLSVIRDHFHAIDLDPGFRIAEEGELKLLEKDVVSELLESRYAEGSDRFLDFSMAYARGKSDKIMEDLIIKIFKYSRSYPDPEAWLSGCQDFYQISTEEELENSMIMERTKKQVFALLRDAIKLNDKALLLATSSNGPYMYEQNLLNDREIIEQILASHTYHELQQAVSGIKYSKLKQNRDSSVDPSKTEAVKQLRKQVKDIVDKVAEKYLSDSVEDILQDLAMCREPLKELISLVQDYGDRFAAAKRKQNMIDFSDMEQFAMKILNEKDEAGNFVPSAAAKEYQDHYKEIMIDEYQDSNLIQETILTSISKVSRGCNNIFMVGDVKQSIYRFRLSRPELFMEKFDTYSVEDSVTQRIDLHKNFRSRGQVLDSVNKIFERIMVRDLGGIRYDKDAALNLGASYLETNDLETELLLFDEDSAAELECSSRELEAHMIAGRIHELKKHHLIQDKKTGELRPVKNSDIVILSRSLSGGFDDTLNEVLTKEGIPVFVGTRSGYFSAYEVGVMLDYLKVLNNRKQDIPLAAVLTSPFGLMTEEELALIKIAGGKLPFWKAVERITTGELELSNESAKEKLLRVFRFLDHYREIVPYTPMHDLLQMIYDETGYMDYVSAMPAGMQRAANLEMLLEKARTFESTSYKGLFHFIRYIDQLQKYEVDYGEASTEDEQSDTVRIMTTHKSKGLEFPIVFVAAMGKKFNFQDAKASVSIHSVLGLGLDAVNLEDRTKRASIVKKMIQREEELETRGEELRILYVALTRAKEKLVMTGTMKNIEKKMSEVAAFVLNEDMTLPYSSLSFANSYLDWILPAIWTEDDPLYRKEILDAETVFSDTVQEIIKDKVAKEQLLVWGNDVPSEETSYQKAFDQQFGYAYPYGSSKNQKLKLTVTELKEKAKRLKSLEHAIEEEGLGLHTSDSNGEVIIPKFMKEEKEELTGASRGTAYHRFLEVFDYRNNPEKITEADVEACKQNFLLSGRMTEEMVTCIRAEDVLSFFKTSSAKRMHQAALRNQLFKEQPFVFGVPADKIYPEAEKNELVLVQGVIDVYFEEEDGFVVLDYKTDKLFRPGEFVDRYKEQLDYYGRALEQMRGKKVKEKLIYSINLNKEILLNS